MKMLEGKTVIVTGASRGIGFHTARIFGEYGARVFMNGRNVDDLMMSVDKLAKESLEVRALPFDVADVSSIKMGFQAFFKESKKLDVIVNNAGVLDDSLIGMTTQKQVIDTYNINTFGVLYCSQYASRLMARNNSGSIISMTSIIGTNGNAGQAVYGGSKAAVIGMTKSLAKELAPNNIRVNAIAPGFIDTDMAKSIPEGVFEERINSIKMNRIGAPEEVAKVALFLASDLSSYVTGQVIGVDGGMLI